MKLLIVYGTRPEAVKLAPLVLALQDDPDLHPVICVTGQHREMVDDVNDLFGIVPHHALHVFEPGQSLPSLTSLVLNGTAEVIGDLRPAAVIVQGDTTSAFAASLAAFYADAPLIHVEAGLRTFDRRLPFPEEANRSLITRLASLNLAPTQSNRDNLLHEGVPSEEIVVTGNTGIDALWLAIERQRPVSNPALRSAIESGQRLVLVTTHRRESWGEPLVRVATALARILTKLQDVRVIVPLHPNPLVREAVEPVLGEVPNAALLEPLSYPDFVAAIRASTLVLTDSGGVQEEAPALGVPVLVLRDNTERPEAVSAGVVRLIGTGEEQVFQATSRLLRNEAARKAMSIAVNPYGDGKAASRSVAAIRHLLLDEPRPSEFGSEAGC